MSNETTRISRRAALQTAIALGAYSATGSRLAFADDSSPANAQLWYQKPAQAWTEALPIGNGRIGAMVFGGVARERLQLNDDTLYAGGPYDPTNPQALHALPRVRALIAEGKYREAQALANERMMAQPLGMPSYQTVGDLMLSFTSSSFASEYRRELDLDAALATVRYRRPDGRDDVLYTREVFASPVDDVIVMRLGASLPGAIGFRAS